MPTRLHPFAALLAAGCAAMLGAGCTVPTGGKAPPAYWSTLDPAGTAVSPRVLQAGPFHFGVLPAVAIVNPDENYRGDDSPWIDRTDEFRARVADALDGYDPATITLADCAWARNNFLDDRLGDDYVWKDTGRNGEEIILVGGKKWESINKYAVVRDTMYPDLFRKRGDPARGIVSVRVVYDLYRGLPGKVPPIQDVTVYLEGLVGNHDHPVPKISFTQIPEQTALALAVEGTAREVPGGRAMDVETPRGRFTVFRPSNPSWLARQEGWNVGTAIVAMLNDLPEDRLLQMQGNED